MKETDETQEVYDIFESISRTTGLETTGLRAGDWCARNGSSLRDYAAKPFYVYYSIRLSSYVHNPINEASFSRVLPKGAVALTDVIIHELNKAAYGIGNFRVQGVGLVPKDKAEKKE